MEVETPSMEVETPSMEVETPSMEVETPSMEVETPSMEVETPSMEVEGSRTRAPSRRIGRLVPFSNIPAKDMRGPFIEAVRAEDRE
jgi:hypothetical protein